MPNCTWALWIYAALIRVRKRSYEDRQTALQSLRGGSRLGFPAGEIAVARQDPKTVPWTRVVRAFVLRDVLEALEREHPGHPLAAVFKPLFVEDERTLERAAVGYFRQIKYSELGTACKANLLEVFVSWLEQRLNQKSKKEIEIMLVGELPALEETQSGKDLIRIGEERGVRRGLARAILVSLRTRYSTVPVAIEDKVHALTVEEAERLLDYLPRCPSLDELDQWFADAKP